MTLGELARLIGSCTCSLISLIPEMTDGVVDLIHLDRVIFQDSIIQRFRVFLQIVIRELADLVIVSYETPFH